ncbi:hypothetical protein BKP35_06565 [Anaerobacillus arseniciselenatis]|uniref:YesK-like protein n=1 Tax=Anaerobacillus arseniciselenatis TaxID=85682 RepID=A0A1S2LQ70_9BACI|nr:hypothetical protein [Anaerobacillus arseniciselenatis]OIJ14536.1 hypothetical protein BKP35_06565 [Anaerobacillus arseniciselenatis]
MEILVAALFGTLFMFGITYVLSQLFIKKFIKYIPALLLIVIGSYLLITARLLGSGGFDNLIMGIWAVMLYYGAIIGIISSVAIDFIRRKKKIS